MVGFWNLGLRMIPNDRARLGLGPPGVFGLQILIFGGHGGPGPPVHRGIFMCFEKIVLQKNMKMVDEDGRMLEFRAENDTK